MALYNFFVRETSATDPWHELPSLVPVTRRERWRAAIYLVALAALITLVVLAVVFDFLAATGVLLVVFLSFVFTYLIAPAVERLRWASAATRKGRPVSRAVALLAMYGGIAALALPVWVLAGPRLSAAAGRTVDTVPQHVARFIDQVRASERWPDVVGVPSGVRHLLAEATRRVSQNVQSEVRALGAELVRVRRLVPWLATVPLITFVLLTRWSRFRRSTTRVLPTPHLQWRADQLLQQVNRVLAAYIRAQATAAVIVGVLCWIGFAVLRLPYPGTLGLVAGVLEMVPLAGPVAVAVIATAMAPERAVPVLVFLAILRVLQDYAIYPRIIGRATRLHPVAVVLALWLGAAVGDIVGLCLAVPVVGALQVTVRNWREYRAIERLVRELKRT